MPKNIYAADLVLNYDLFFSPISLLRFRCFFFFNSPPFDLTHTNVHWLCTFANRCFLQSESLRDYQ